MIARALPLSKGARSYIQSRVAGQGHLGHLLADIRLSQGGYVFTCVDNDSPPLCHGDRDSLLEYDPVRAWPLAAEQADVHAVSRALARFSSVGATAMVVFDTLRRPSDHAGPEAPAAFTVDGEDMYYWVAMPCDYRPILAAWGYVHGQYPEPFAVLADAPDLPSVPHFGDARSTALLGLVADQALALVVDAYDGDGCIMWTRDAPDWAALDLAAP